LWIGVHSKDTLLQIFHCSYSTVRLVDVDGNGELDFAEFQACVMLDGAEIIRKLHHAATNRDDKGLLQVLPSNEEYFGAIMHQAAKPGITPFAQARSQHFSMELYESRIASLERFAAFCVIFHQMGKKVQDFFPRYSCGVLGYEMNRTQSIVRIATTASPVSGDAVRDQMELMRVKAGIENAVHVIANACKQKQQEFLQHLKQMHMSLSSLEGQRESSRLLQFEDNNMNESLHASLHLEDDGCLKVKTAILSDPGSTGDATTLSENGKE
jgi:hypothetical protein